jgi:hypothetical protein
MFDVVRVKGEVRTAADLVTQVKVKDFSKEVRTLHRASGWMSSKTRIQHQQKAASLIGSVPLAERKRLLVPGVTAKLNQLAALRDAVRIMNLGHEAWACAGREEYFDIVSRLYRRSEPLDLGRLAVIEHKIAELEIEVGERRRS